MDETNTLIEQRKAKLKALIERGLNPFARTVLGQESIRDVILFPQLRPLPPPPAGH